MRRGTILAFMAGALASAIGWLAASAESPGDKTSTANSGRKADGAFFIDFTRGFDPATHVLADWDAVSDWLAASYRADNAQYGESGLTLRARRIRTKVADYTSGEFQRSGFYGYGRYEVVMRASDAPGVVSSFFTYSGPDIGDPHDEIDFELLGRSPRQLHTNYFSNDANDPEDIDLWFDASAGEHLYAFEWRPTSITWFVDGVKVREVTAGPETRLPSTTARVMASVWAANRRVTEWVGSPDMTTATAIYRCISHVPAGKKGRQCSDSFKPPMLPH